MTSAVPRVLSNGLRIGAVRNHAVSLQVLSLHHLLHFIDCHDCSALHTLHSSEDVALLDKFVEYILNSAVQFVVLVGRYSSEVRMFAL